MEFVEVAKIVNSHGIKGAVKVFLFTDNIERFKENCKFYIDKKFKVTIKSTRALANNYAILMFNEYNNINEILQFKNLSLFVEEKDLKNLSDDEFYVYKLIGLEVYNQNDEFVGKVKDVLSTLANDVFEIDSNEKSIYVPVVKEFIKEIDLVNSKMKINFIKGMLDD